MAKRTLVEQMIFEGNQAQLTKYIRALESRNKQLEAELEAVLLIQSIKP